MSNQDVILLIAAVMVVVALALVAQALWGG